MNITTETFFRPPENSCEQLNLPAPVFNRCVLLLNHSNSKNVFVPIRPMQLQAIIDESEIIFVDSQSYAVQEGQSGRLIIVAWKVLLHCARDSLNEPVPIEVAYYGNENHDTHRRLMSEFPRALEASEARMKDGDESEKTATVLPFRTNTQA